jgi:hypothetical protein
VRVGEVDALLAGEDPMKRTTPGDDMKSANAASSGEGALPIRITS